MKHIDWHLSRYVTYPMSIAAMNIVQHTDTTFLAAIHDADLETLIASGNPQLLQALDELEQLW